MIAATAARPPRTGVRIPVSPETRWYAASTGTPRKLDMRTTAFQLRRDEGWRRPRGPRECVRGSARTAAAGAADGALGLDRPAASGSRWRKNAARQDFSRSAEARRIIGRAAVARERLATEVSRASTAANMAPARTAAGQRGQSGRADRELREVAQQPGQHGQQAAEHRHRRHPVLGLDRESGTCVFRRTPSGKLARPRPAGGRRRPRRCSAPGRPGRRRRSPAARARPASSHA